MSPVNQRWSGTSPPCFGYILQSTLEQGWPRAQHLSSYNSFTLSHTKGAEHEPHKVKRGICKVQQLSTTLKHEKAMCAYIGT